MKKLVLSKEEKEVERNFENLQPISSEAKKNVERIIEGSKKSQPISLRINKIDLEILKEKANRSGLPYQTMINVIIHKYVNDDYLDKLEINKFIKLKKAA
jgi:predicted DNA binding CopG/RHH family protein